MKNIDDYIDNEWFVVRHSGEMPEVAYHSSLHFLCEVKDGPRLSLTDCQMHKLQMAAIERYQEIILRDLLPENRDTTMYRGVERAIVNYHRFQQFCHRQQLLMPTNFNKEVAVSLQMLLEAEAADARRGVNQSALNCSFHDLKMFVMEIGLGSEVLSAKIEDICRESCSLEALSGI